MLQILVIWKPLDNHIEFEWKFKFLMKNYESVCWHGGNPSYLVATRPILTFAPSWIWILNIMDFFNLQNCCYFSFCIHYKFRFFSLFVCFFQCSIMMHQLPRGLIMSIFNKLLMKLSMKLHLTLMLMPLLDLNLEIWFCYNMHTFSL